MFCEPQLHLWEWIDVSFIYWQPSQQNMEPATAKSLDTRYAPGFKVGAGTFLNHHNWRASLEYTHLHSTHRRSSKTSEEAALQGIHYIPAWLNSINADTIAPMITAFHTSWTLHLDLLDTLLSSSCSISPHFNLQTSFGVRSAWIDQNRTAKYSDILRSELEGINREKTTSFGIGPRICLETEWIVTEGFKLIERSGFDILFTQYTTKGHSTNLFDEQTTLRTNTKHTHINTLRPHIDIELGVGWETYFERHQLHLDLSTTYGFQVFWNQNMFPFSSGSPNIHFNTPNGDLYINGLTLTAKLEF